MLRMIISIEDSSSKTLISRIALSILRLTECALKCAVIAYYSFAPPARARDWSGARSAFRSDGIAASSAAMTERRNGAIA